MPKEIKDIRDFLLMTRCPDVKHITIHKKTVTTPASQSGTRHVAGASRQVTKFKLRRSRYLYTLTIDAKDKAAKLASSLPPELVKTTTKKKTVKK